MLAKISHLVLMVRGSEGIASAVNFYHKAVGLPVLRVTDEWAELSASGGDASGVTLQIVAANAASGEAALSTGYSPLLTFSVTDMDTTIAACVQAGGNLDGPIQYPAHGKVAALRSPHGHMIGLYEPAAVSTPTTGASSN